MQRLVVRHLFGLMVALMICIPQTGEFGSARAGQWENPFPEKDMWPAQQLDTLTLDDVLALVARDNPLLKAGPLSIQAADQRIKQAGARPNPELEIEVEETGLDAPGFRKSELTVLLSQEIELWGKRGHRRNVAQRKLETVRWETVLESYEIYAATAERFVELGHAQKQTDHALEATQLAEAVTESARKRVENGAAMASELLLAKLELERAGLELAKAESDLANARDELASLWKGEGQHLVVVQSDLDPAIVSDLDDLQALVDGSREVLAMEKEAGLLNAQLHREKAEGKPNLSVGGGYRRSAVDGSNTLVFGVGLPMPLFDRNQGIVSALVAQAEVTRLGREQALLNARTKFKTIVRRIEQSFSRYFAIDTVLIPLAEETYHSLMEAYEKGKLPYSTLLEGERTLIYLYIERNNLDLSIKQEIIALERLLGVTLLN